MVFFQPIPIRQQGTYRYKLNIVTVNNIRNVYLKVGKNTFYDPLRKQTIILTVALLNVKSIIICLYQLSQRPASTIRNAPNFAAKWSSFRVVVDFQATSSSAALLMICLKSCALGIYFASCNRVFVVIIPIFDFVFLFLSDADEHKEFIFSETEMSNLGQLLSSSKTEEEEAQKEVRH